MNFNWSSGRYITVLSAIAMYYTIMYLILRLWCPYRWISFM